MCKKQKGLHNRIDKCMKPLVIYFMSKGLRLKACCCGHNKYSISIVFQGIDDNFYELLTGITIPRSRKFYVKDKQGYYYIPEISGEKLT